MENLMTQFITELLMLRRAYQFDLVDYGCPADYQSEAVDIIESEKFAPLLKGPNGVANLQAMVFVMLHRATIH